MSTTSDSEQTTQSGQQSDSRASNTRLKIRESVKKNWTLMVISVILILIIWTPYFATGHEWKSPDIRWLPISIMATIISITALILWKKWWFFKKITQFNALIFGIAIIGGTIAFLLPLAIAGEFLKDSESTTLRQMILYTTGGLLGVITLSETRRKNDLDQNRLDDQKIQFEKQLDSQKKNLELQLARQLESQREQINSQKEKDEREHIRQVYTERRSRYTKAIEQLASENAAVRLGGVYTLAGLVDEWLADASLKQEDKKKEGQVIINNLCSYIRLPFPLAKNIEDFKEDKANITEDQATILEEQDVRRAIFIEMSKRSSTFDKNKNQLILKNRGAWSSFEFDFSRAPIFYPLNGITIEEGKFSSAKFYGAANFTDTFFTQNTKFDNAQFIQGANFSNAGFFQNADFNNVVFTQDANFNITTFRQKANFSGTAFKQKANFYNAGFTKETNFDKATFSQNANFDITTFIQKANFSGATFKQDANFFWVTFSQDAKFDNTIFTQNANFDNSTFSQNAKFNGATFTQNAKFNEANFKEFMPTFAAGSSRARFSIQTTQEDYNFSVRSGSKLINRGETKLDDVTDKIPIGTVLFAPDSWDKEKREYTRVSEPAK